MKLQVYLFLIFIVTLITLGTWLLILFNIDPGTADFISTSAFFASFFTWVAGILTFIFFYVRIKMTNKEIIFAHLPQSLRQAVLVSLSITLIAVLSMLKVLTWWSAVMLAVTILLLELFFRTKKV